MRLPLSLTTVILGLALAVGASAQQPRSEGGAFVDRAVEDAEKAQQRDGDIVREMSEEAARAVEGAPSGAESIGSTATPAEAGDRAPTIALGQGLSLRDLIDQQLADRNGRPVGKIRDVLLGAESAGVLVLVEGDGGVIRAVNIARVTPADAGQGYTVDLDGDSLAALPSYRQDGRRWSMVE